MPFGDIRVSIHPARLASVIPDPLSALNCRGPVHLSERQSPGGPLHFSDPANAWLFLPAPFCGYTLLQHCLPQLGSLSTKQLRRRKILAGCLLFKLTDKRHFLSGSLFLSLRKNTGFRRNLRNQRQIILLTNPATVSGLSDLLLNTL